MKVAAFALLMLAAPVAQAATTDEIFALYAKGSYDQAARAGEAAHTAPGLAIAARAILADEVLRDAPCLPCLQHAEDLARQAITIDPHHSYGQIWLAVALGYQSRITGVVRARLKDAPGQSKTALDMAVADDPKNAFAVSALGGWNMEIVRGGGATLARMLYGATESQAISLFDRAVKLAPGNVAVHYQIALSLVGYDEEKYHARIVTELRAAVAGDAATAYEKKIQDRANDLLGLVNRGPQDALTTMVRKYQGYPD